MIIRSFQYPLIDEQTRTYAGIAPIINLNGDWTQFLTPFEEQRVDGTEPSDCYIQAQQSCIAILIEYIYGIKDSDFLADFNALLSGGTPNGGDPIKGALSIKKDGLISQTMRDRTDLKNWQEYHSWKGMDKEKCLLEGKNFVSKWDMTFRVVVEKDIPLKTKYELLKEELKRCPPPISFYAWAERNGKYYKPEGVRDTHLIDAICLKVTDNNEIVIKDTYEPFLKTLEANSDFEFAMGWTIRRRSPQEQLNNTQKNFIIILLEYVKLLVQKLYRVGGEILGAIFSKRN
jgi:hypothetical protein